MNKTAIKNFAIWSRNKLIADVSYQAGLLGITETGIAKALPQSSGTTEFYDIGIDEPYVVTDEAIRQRRRLVERIRQKEADTDYAMAYKYIIEEAAYTWFNRLIAVRFMEVNDYLPARIRVLSSESGKIEPDIVTKPFDAELDLSADEESLIMQLKTDNKLDELFQMLFIKQCNALNAYLPALFEKTNDYTELLLNLSVIDQDGVVWHLVNDIPEDDFNVERGGQVEIIGWLYQYYNEERKNIVININKSTVQKEDIPAATQLFTTDWVVRYIVDNSLGRYWLERNPESSLRNKLEYFAVPKDKDIPVINERVQPEELTIFDPCMGSAHFLVYAFDVLMEIYSECGYSDREAAQSILRNNIYGLDIDDRAFQLAYFAVMMKARQYDRKVLTRGITPHVYSIPESTGMERGHLKYFGTDFDVKRRETALKQIKVLLDEFRDGKECGSILQVTEFDYDLLSSFIEDLTVPGQISVETMGIEQTQSQLYALLESASLLIRKYTVVTTNPPFLNKMDVKLKKYVTDYYKNYGGDLFSVFIYRNFDFCKVGGYSGFMSPYVWMFIKTYEKLRRYIIDNKSITTLIQMEYSAFEEATVPICSFVLKNEKTSDEGIYFRLTEFRGGMEVQRQKVLEALQEPKCGYIYTARQENFKKIPGSPVAYWVSENTLRAFQNKSLSNYVNCKSGIMTGSDQFIRIWFEVDINNIKFDCKSKADMGDYRWFPLNSGGDFRKWFGNNSKIVNLWNDGFDIKNNVKNFRLRDPEFYFRHGVTWGRITSSQIAFRDVIDGSLFGDAGPIGFVDDRKYYILGFLCSNVVTSLLEAKNPTLNFQVHDIMELPLQYSGERADSIEYLVKQNISYSRLDWDSFETSWDFKTHPLIECYKSTLDMTCTMVTIDHYYEGNAPEIQSALEVAYHLWKFECDERFKKLKENEEELNRIFIDIYGLQDELTPDVADKDVTVRRFFDSKDDISEEMRGGNYALTRRDAVVSLISYAVGCMFGRYSLDVDGIAYAGGDWDNSKYSTFIPDADNCIPISDEEYFKDDIVGLFCAWLKAAYGEKTLEQNLDFIAQALGNKGNTSREVIRNYFLKDFFADHCKTYQKRPIYWLFDSGKQNGFKALVYMHRWTSDTIGTVNADYLLRSQRVYESEINRMQDMTDHSQNPREAAAASKRKEKLSKQLKECKAYYEKLSHLALERIDIDLDDGVKVNYRKVQTGSDGKFYEVLADSKNIMAKK